MLKHGYACSNPKEEKSMAGSGEDEDLRRHEIYEDEYIEQGRGSGSKMTYRYEDSSTTSTGSWYYLTIMRNSSEKNGREIGTSKIKFSFKVLFLKKN